jgi:hypothetical protein
VDPLERVRGKVNRAQEHAQSLSNDISAAVRGPDNPYRLVPELDLDAGKCSLRVEKVAEFPRPQWETVVGEIVHNLRSALDQLAYQLALLNRADDDALRGCEFPIFVDRDRFNGGSKGSGVYKMRALATRDQHIIESVQPFDFPEHPLWVLQQMSNSDKHRLGVSFADTIGLPVTIGPRFIDLDASMERWEPLGSYEDGQVIQIFKVVRTGLNPRVEVKFRPTISVTVDEGIGRTPSHIGQVVPKLLRIVDQIVETFALRFTD